MGAWWQVRSLVSDRLNEHYILYVHIEHMLGHKAKMFAACLTRSLEKLWSQDEIPETLKVYVEAFASDRRHYIREDLDLKNRQDGNFIGCHQRLRYDWARMSLQVSDVIRSMLLSGCCWLMSARLSQLWRLLSFRDFWSMRNESESRSYWFRDPVVITSNNFLTDFDFKFRQKLRRRISHHENFINLKFQKIAKNQEQCRSDA